MIKKGIYTLLSFIFLLTACSGTAPVPSTTEPVPSQEPLRKIVVILQCCYLSDSGFLVAQENGYFAEQGLEVELVRYNSFSEGIAAMLSGQADLWGGGIDPGLFNAIARGDGLKLIADKGQVPDDCDYMSMAVRKEDIEKYSRLVPGQLENARIAASGTQTGSFYVDTALRSVGSSLTELDSTDIPGPTRLESLLNGSVDISLLGEPWVTTGIETDKIALWIPPKDIMPRLQISTWVAGAQALKNKPDEIQKFITAYLKGIHFVNQGKTTELVDMIAKGTKMESTLVNRMCIPGFANDGVVNIESIDQYQDWLISNGWLDAKVESQRYWDGSFVERAQRELEQVGQ